MQTIQKLLMVVAKLQTLSCGGMRRHAVFFSRPTRVFILACALVLHALILPALGQQTPPPYQQLTTEHGLPHNLTYDIIQGGRGFLWIATRDGLVRYDGTGFKVYKHDPLDSTTISNNWIYKLYEDASRTLWIGTNRGLNRFNRDGETFTHYLPDPNYPNIRAIYEDRAGRLWIGNWSKAGGLFKLDRQNDTLTRYDLDPKNPAVSPKNSVRCIIEDDAGMLWVGTEQAGLNRFDPEKEIVVHHYRHDPDDPHSIGDNSVWYSLKDRAGNLWFATGSGGLCRYDPQVDGFIRYRHDPANPQSLYHDHVLALFQDAGGAIWVSDAVLSRFDPGTQTFTHFLFSKSQVDWSNDFSPHGIYEDRSHNLWVATRGSGILKIDLKPKRFTHYAHDPNAPNSLGDNNVALIYESAKGLLWIGAKQGGVDRFDPQSGQFAHFKHNPDDSTSLSNDIILTILEDHTGALWVGTKAGLNKFNPTDERFTRYMHDPDDPHSISDDWVETIFEDHEGILWIGTRDGLNVFDRESETFERFKPDPGAEPVLATNYIVTLYEDRRDNLWVAAFNGQYRFDRHTKQFSPIKKLEEGDEGWGIILVEDQTGTLWGGINGLNKLDSDNGEFVRYRFMHNPQHRHGFDRGYNHPYSILVDDEGMIWCGMQNNGLLKFDPSRNKFVAHYLEKDGLLSTIIYKILADDAGNLWLLTPRGISVFNEDKPPGQRFSNLGPQNGINNAAHLNLRGAFMKTRNGEIYWGGTNGIYRFYPNVKNTNPTIPAIRLTQFTLFDQPADLDTAISEIKTIKLAHDQNFFSLGFAALDFTDPLKNRYAYRLEGVDQDWVDAGNKRIAKYTNVSPGEYTFRAKGSNNDGVWNEEGASVKIIIRPPYWARWWFRSVVALSVILMIFALYRYRVNRLLEIERMRLRIARDLHDDIGSSLSSIALESELVQRKVPLSEKEQTRLSSIAERSRHLIESLDDIVWAITPANDRLDNLLLRMQETAADLLSKKRIRCTFQFTKDELPHCMEMEYRRHLFLIFKELLQNVLKHAQASHVAISLAKQGGSLVLRVKDDGVGFKETAVRNGNGLTNMKMRALRINGQIEFQTPPEGGCEAVLAVKIP
ncbi:MAG: two-component regulator propeller domain-containing protein [bacterium]